MSLRLKAQVREELVKAMRLAGVVPDFDWNAERAAIERRLNIQFTVFQNLEGTIRYSFRPVRRYTPESYYEKLMGMMNMNAEETARRFRQAYGCLLYTSPSPRDS